MVSRQDRSQKRLIVAAVAVLSFAAGFLVAEKSPSRIPPAAPEVKPAYTLPTAAQRLWFPPLTEYATNGEPLENEKFDGLLEILKKRLAAKETTADFAREATIYLHSFVRRISNPLLEPEQINRIMRYLTELEERHPDQRALIIFHRSMIERSTPANSPVQPFRTAASWFPRIETLQADNKQFSDAAIERLISVLDSLLSMPETALDIESEAGSHIRSFTHALQQRRATKKQIAQVGAYLHEVEARYPALGELIDRNRFRIEKLSPGRVAPNIKGTDLDGVDFQLRDYLGNIVVIYFTGQWCAPCRNEYPYQRFMLEIFQDHPVTLLAVNSDDDRDYARNARKDLNLHFRAWWDGYGEHHAKGPIATAWDVKEWPTTYVLDADGVVRYVRKRHLEVVRAVQQLLNEMPVAATTELPNET